MTRFAPHLFVVALAMSLGAAAPAAARSPCDARSLPEGPVPVGFGQADFGVVPSACPRSELGLSLDGRAIVESANFYGNLRGAGRFDASFQPLPQLELFASAELVAYQQVIQSFKADHLGIGDTSVGGKLLAFTSRSFGLSVIARADLPTAFGYYANSYPVGLEAGLLTVVEPIESLRLHAGLLGATDFAVTNADSGGRAAIIANAGVDIVLLEWLALVGDLDGQALQRGGLDHIALGGGARFDFGGIGAEVGVVVPVAGDERNLASFVLRAAWRY